ncbi:MAG: flagellar hook-associated protein FlgK [Candidatus Solibacter usitatus]|nr:flagellar hook-associated protein FlgK [Candidatus Solibacter usitatus]
MSLFTAVGASADALENFQRALETIQNNVSNASTPGFARQTQLFTADPFDPEHGLAGGSSLGARQSARDELAEAGVRRQASLEGRFGQLSATLERVEPLFDATGQTGLPQALGRLFDSFSSWSINPNDASSRQQVLDRAVQLARSFQGQSQALRSAEAGERRQIPGQVERINQLTGLIRDHNLHVRDNAGAGSDPGVDAQVHSQLEELSQWADIQALRQNDGSFTVLLGGQTPLVIGNRQYALQADLSAIPARVLDAQGADVTAHIGGGRLAGTLQAANVTLPRFIADLDTLAQGVADAVNQTLAAGIDSTGQPGTALFTYNQPSDAAATIAVAAITPGQLAAAHPASPGGNGNALDLAALARSVQINGYTFTGFYGQLSAAVGSELASARDSRDSHLELLAQARELRAQTQGVSLNEEAARLIEFQRAYQAAAKMVTTLDELTRATIEMIR